MYKKSGLELVTFHEIWFIMFGMSILRHRSQINSKVFSYAIELNIGLTTSTVSGGILLH
jgi:hypothetical protein